MEKAVSSRRSRPPRGEAAQAAWLESVAGYFSEARDVYYAVPIPDPSVLRPDPEAAAVGLFRLGQALARAGRLSGTIRVRVLTLGLFPVASEAECVSGGRSHAGPRPHPRPRIPRSRHLPHRYASHPLGISASPLWESQLRCAASDASPRPGAVLAWRGENLYARAWERPESATAAPSAPVSLRAEGTYLIAGGGGGLGLALAGISGGTLAGPPGAPGPQPGG